MDNLIVQIPSHYVPPDLVISATRLNPDIIIDISCRPSGNDSLKYCLNTLNLKSLGLRLEVLPGDKIDLKSKLKALKYRLSELNAAAIGYLVLGGNSKNNSALIGFGKTIANKVVVEVGSIESALSAYASGAEAVILRGNESDGQMSESSSFILLQAANKKLKGREYWIAGSIGINAARAAIRLGASAVILNEQLWKPEGSGQENVLYEVYSKKYGSISGIISAYRRSLKQSPQNIFHEQSKICFEHKTKSPIVQGPMTRVSDTPAFLKIVADAGALPFFALAVLKNTEAEKLLLETKRLLKDRSWGIGILGFLPPEMLQDQLSLVAKISPSFAIISGGKPSQAKIFEELGIKTYLHVPSPRILSMFIQSGARRFLFEGNECGGHIGPRSSFLIWELAVEEILNHPEIIPDLSILCAGGIHDGISAAAASEIFAPLANKGAKIGILMGSAYLYTKEAVTSGAIVSEYQKQIKKGKKTALLESGLGYRTRCLPTPFTHEFNKQRQKLLKAKLPLEQTIAELEALNVGRLRIAAKGKQRENKKGPGLKKLSAKEQLNSGLYMIGDLSSIRDRLCTIDELHKSVLSKPSRIPSPLPRSQDIAIVAMDCIFPRAESLLSYWENIINKVNAIGEIPESRWDVRSYFDSDRKAPDKTYSKWGGFIEPLGFDPLAFGIPPASLSSISASQLLALEVSRRVLESAGIENGSSLREKIAVIFGSADVGDLAAQYNFRSLLPHYLNVVKDVSEEDKNKIAKSVIDHLPEWTEDSLPGILQNVVAGRVANRLNLGGANFTVDAACASSFAALDAGVKILRAGTCEAALIGAVETSNTIFSYMAFSKTGALSSKGRCRPFDKNADGIVLSEGAAAVLLLPLERAKDEGFRVQAVIKGIGSSSDGRNLSLTAPHVDGQARAVNAAYKDAGIDPNTVSLIEAHGTGTVLGDAAEIAVLKKVFAGSMKGAIALGSVKSMLGHTKTAAGFAGLIKTVMSLEQKVLPPTIGIEEPNPSLSGSESPFYLSTNLRPWQDDAESPRRAAVSAFGFGGTNYHVVLEEFNDAKSSPENLWQRGCEIIFVSAENKFKAIELLKKAIIHAANNPSNLVQTAHLVSSLCKGKAADKFKLAFTLSSTAKINLRLEEVIKLLQSANSSSSDGVYFGQLRQNNQKICLLFPGQGAQYTGMLKSLVLGSLGAKELISETESLLRGCLEKPLLDFIYPKGVVNKNDIKFHEAVLAESEIAQPALCLMHMAAFDVLNSLGFSPDYFAGHSFGEYSALCAAGVFSRSALIKGAYERGVVCKKATESSPGGLLVVAEPDKKVKKIIKQSGIEAEIAGSNSLSQTLVGANLKNLSKLSAYFRNLKIAVSELSVPAPFHTSFMKGPAAELEAVLDRIDFSKPKVPVFSNITANIYPSSTQKIKSILARHMQEPLLFAEELKALYAKGVRTFIEVGPGVTLSSLIKQMNFKECRVLSMDLKANRASAGDLNLWPNVAELVSSLFSLGRIENFEEWFKGRLSWNYNYRPVEDPEYLLDGARISRNHKYSAGTLAYKSLPPLKVSPNFGRIEGANSERGENVLKQNTAKSENLTFTEVLLRTVSECTGYSEKMLNLDVDLSSELGIDSIKRIEIASRLIEYDKEIVSGGEDAAFEILSKLNTLRDIISWYENDFQKAGNTGRSELPLNGVKALIKSGVKRYEITAVPESLTLPEKDSALIEKFPGGVALICGKDTKARQDLENELKKAKIKVEFLNPEDIRIPGSLPNLAALFFMADSSDKNINPSERFFSLLKELIKRNLLDKNAWIATITAIDGRFGLSGVKFEMQSANLAGPAGVAKCLAKEYPAFNIRCIDTVSFESGENLGRNILNEFLKGKKFSEVGYDKEGRWKISVAESARTDFNIAARPPSISKDDLILITGGLSGITAEITLKVAKKYSPKIVLLGRSELKGKQEETFREIKKYASSLEYIKQDVSDENSLSKCLRQISKHYAKIDGIIHGAGIIRDKLIRDKSKESFLEVYQTKTVLLKVLEQQLDFEKLKFIFLFSSIAARWGNHGQSDYCAANEVLNKWASAAAAKWPNINAVSFNWGPWDRKEGGHGGMLSKELAAIYKANGIELISLEQGSELCLEELYLSKSRQTSEVLISGSVQQIGKEYFKEEPSSNAV